MPSATSLPEVPLNTIKVLCISCERIEPFHPSGQTFFNLEDDNKKRKQNFILEYECQACNDKIVFMVRREGFKLMLTGRSPMEHIPVPSVMPKRYKKYFSDAIVANNAGQTLAGLFLLRTFIEQYTRGLSEKPKQLADKIIEEYMKKLTSDFKRRFPSMAKMYSDLSEAIHAAPIGLPAFSSIDSLILQAKFPLHP